MKILKGLCSVVLVAVLCLSLSVVSFASAAVTGDANGDKVVNLRDLVRIKRYTAKTIDVIDLDAVDFNADGIVNAYEIVELRSMLINSEIPEMIINVEKFEDKY